MSLKEIITTYKAPEGAAQLVNDTKPVFLVGITGAGKDTLKRSLLETGEFHDVVSHTTRKPRINSGVPEVDGSDYHFITPEEAEQLAAEEAFIEVKYVHGTVYGTSVDEFKIARRDERVAITDIDVQGVDEYYQLSDQVVAVFILPSSVDEWRKRLLHRYGSEAALSAEWTVRLKSAVKEIRHALEAGYYLFLVNDQLEEAQKDLTEMIRAYRQGQSVDDQAARQLAEELLTQLTP